MKCKRLDTEQVAKVIETPVLCLLGHQEFPHPKPDLDPFSRGRTAKLTDRQTPGPSVAFDAA